MFTKRALIIASVASMIDQFNIPNIKLLVSLGYKVDVACNFKCGNTCDNYRIGNFKKELEALNVGYYQIDFERNVKKINKHIKAYRQIKSVLKKNKYTLVHCHSPIGGLLGRLASNKYRKKGTKVIYTAHGFHFYKGAPIINWVLYYPIEKMCSMITDVLITINREDYVFAKKHMKAKTLEYVSGVGVDFKKFEKNTLTKDQIANKTKSLGAEKDEIIFLSVGELSKNKNHAFVLKTLSKFCNYNWKYYIAGQGVLKTYLQDLACKLGIRDRVFFLGYRLDVCELYKCSDLFIFPSCREGLPISLLEAIVSKTPVIASNIRGNRDLLSNSNLFNLDDEKVLKEYIKRTLEEERLVANLNTNINDYDINSVMKKMRIIYSMDNN